ncbi:MAG: alpha/beta hydrolase [Parafilimonas sp.]
MTNKINIVLVHGAWADASSWSKIIHILSEDYNVVATQHSLTSLQDDVETTRRLVEAQQGKTVLVGHSYGGAVITETAHYCATVKALVYIAAFAPDAGENLIELSQHSKQAPGNAAVYPDKYERLWIDKEKFHAAFCADATNDEAIVMAAVQKPIAMRCFSDKITTAAWKNLPCYYQVSDDDKMIAPELEKFMAERMNAKKIIHLPASHASMISHPEEVAALIIEAAKQI